MTKQKMISARPIEIGDFKAWYFDTKPPRLEAIFSFHKDNFSQKLVYSMMDITHKHGLACSAPSFDNKNNPDHVVFCVGTELPSSRSLRKYSLKLHSFFDDIMKFNEAFSRQLDFSIIDLSMFTGIDFDYFDPLTMATVRDQYYNGSWEKFYKDMIREERDEDADFVDRCKLFEELNGKDIALVSSQLDNILSIVDALGRYKQ